MPRGTLALTPSLPLADLVEVMGGGGRGEVADSEVDADMGERGWMRGGRGWRGGWRERERDGRELLVLLLME